MGRSIAEVARFELENRLDRLAEQPRDLEGQQGRRDELARFDGVDGLAADSDGIGQLLLGHALDGARHPDVILHGRCFCGTATERLGESG